MESQKLKNNIIAHSMGNRVLLKMMDLLGEDDSNADIIEHVFLCEAAVPQNALSDDPKKDISVKQNCHFINATKVAKKISVLYSKHDGVLMLGYPAGNMLVKNNKPKNKLQQIAEYMGAIGITISVVDLAETIRPALGLVGPDQDTINSMGAKLIRANTSKSIHSHSAMRFMTPDIKTNVYQKWIIGGKDGMSEFGLWKG